MHTFKAENLTANVEIKFKEWHQKIKENSKLSIGSVIFTYEYQSDGKIKNEKYKSNLNEITIKEVFKLVPDQIITSETCLFTYEKCTHPVKSKDMCAICGEDLKKRVETSVKLVKSITTNGSSSASFQMVHVDPSLHISEELALEIGKKDLIYLVKNRKLVLLVDLDHTLIHTTNEHVNPNLKDVYHYELIQRNIWYHTKFRPGCKKFLEEMSKLYELHMVTFGERNYAHKIADLMDPGRKYFQDRILSRNEIFNPMSKSDNLRALFPRGDLMVCIIDDREDVWNYARNLICVQPYVYFKNTGDINDPSLINNKSQRKRKLNDNNNQAITSKSTENKESNEDDNSNSSLNENNTNEQQSKEEKIEDTEEKDTKTEEKSVTQKSKESDDDTDDYLIYLEDILRKIHDEYYQIYESRLKSHKKPINEDIDIDESDLPDVKKVLPLIKSRIFENCVITFSGVVPTGYDLKKQRCYLMATSLGAKVNENLVLADDESDFEALEPKKSKYEYNYDDNDSSSNCSGGDTKSDDSDEIKFSNNNESNSENKKPRKRFTTHLVAARYGTSKVHDALKSKIPIKVVTPEWLIDSNYRWIKCDEDKYKLTKEYDYKNCLFHHEYNMHQKYSSNNTNNNSSKNSNQIKFSQVKFADQIFKSEKDKEKSKLFKNESNASLSSLETKTKKAKSDFSDENEENGLSSSELISKDMLDLMDKEVNDELDDTLDSENDDTEDKDEDEEDEENGGESENDKQQDENSNTSDSNDSESSLDPKNDRKKSGKNFSTLSSSSSDSFNSGDDDSIDDEFALELERNLTNRK